MSATLIFEKYIKYFELDEINWFDIADVKGLGLPFAIEMKYLDKYETPFLKEHNLLSNS